MINNTIIAFGFFFAFSSTLFAFAMWFSEPNPAKKERVYVQVLAGGLVLTGAVCGSLWLLEFFL